LEQAEAPWGDDGKTPTFDMCDCCGVEFGYEDSTPEGARRFRQRWLAAGAKWLVRKGMPGGWDLNTQLLQVPEAFR
jgi:hypothetical protein